MGYAGVLFSPPGYPAQKPDVGAWLLPITPGPAGSSAPTANTAMLSVFPLLVSFPTSFDRIGFGLTTAQAAAALRIGIYGFNGGVPTAAPLILDCGALDLSAGSGTIVTATISLTLAAGMYWSAGWLKDSATSPTGICTNSTAGVGLIMGDAIIAVATSARALRLASAYPGSMPANLPSGLVAFNGSVPVPQYRVSA